MNFHSERIEKWEGYLESIPGAFKTLAEKLIKKEDVSEDMDCFMNHIRTTPATKFDMSVHLERLRVANQLTIDSGALEDSLCDILSKVEGWDKAGDDGGAVEGREHFKMQGSPEGDGILFTIANSETELFVHMATEESHRLSMLILQTLAEQRAISGLIGQFSMKVEVDDDEDEGDWDDEEDDEDGWGDGHEIERNE